MAGVLRPVSNFDLYIDPLTPSGYPLRVNTDTVLQVSNKDFFRIPYTPSELEDILAKLHEKWQWFDLSKAEIESPIAADAQEFGTRLFDALFTGSIGRTYIKHYSQTGQMRANVRLRLHINAPELVELPWELLYDAIDRDGYVCLLGDVFFVRYLDVALSPQPVVVNRPLRVLGMIAAPDDKPILNTETEKRLIEDALAPLRASRQVELRWVDGQNWRALSKALQQGPWHVFHFIGHADSGELAFVAADGTTERFPAKKLAGMLSSTYFTEPLQLVILNACRTASGDTRSIFTSTAASLIRQGIPMVLGMQYPISDGASHEFARSFYDALANGLPVDYASKQARDAVSFAQATSLEWATPVLFMRAESGQIVAAEEAQQAYIPPPVNQATAVPVPVATSVPSASDPRYKPLIDTLRKRLGGGDVRDITADFGSRTGQGFGSDWLTTGGVNDRVFALVEYAVHHDALPLLISVVIEWRPDLKGAIQLP